MFGKFKKKKKYEPLNYDDRKWFENNMLWLNQEFPDPKIEERKVFTPTKDSFPIVWDKSEKSAMKVLEIIAQAMNINTDEIDLEFYDANIKEINSGAAPIFIHQDETNTDSSGIFLEKNEFGKYTIAINKENLSSPDSLIATITHELSHVKLLGEQRIEENDEIITDLCTVFFGFGIFNANTSFQFHSSNDRWGYKQLGYMKIEEWAYALALFTFMRYEDAPEWSKYLNNTIKRDFDKALIYLIENKDEIFKFND